MRQYKSKFKIMYTVYLFFAITFIGTVVYCCKSDWDSQWEFEDYLLLLLISGLHGVIGAVVGFLIGWCFPMDYETVKWDREIVSLKDNSSIKGRFYLGSGRVEGSIKYVFYVENDDDSYSMRMLDYYDAKIRYSESAPNVKTTQTRPIKNQWNNWAIDMDRVETKYLIEVPSGTIKNDFQLDSE